MEGGGKEVRGQRLKETRKGRPLSPSHLSLSPSHLSLSHSLPLSLSPSLPPVHPRALLARESRRLIHSRPGATPPRGEAEGAGVGWPRRRYFVAEQQAGGLEVGGAGGRRRGGAEGGREGGASGSGQGLARGTARGAACRSGVGVGERGGGGGGRGWQQLHLDGSCTRVGAPRWGGVGWGGVTVGDGGPCQARQAWRRSPALTIKVLIIF